MLTNSRRQVTKARNHSSRIFAGHNYLVRVKTSITLPADLLCRLDRVDNNRSALLERAALAYLAHIEREKQDERDLEIIDRNAKRLNREALDTLEYPAIAVKRGEDPRKQRVSVVVSRQALIDAPDAAKVFPPRQSCQGSDRTYQAEDAPLFGPIATSGNPKSRA
jgi:hypothetical protein